MELQNMPGGWRAHPTAEISDKAAIGAGTVLWRNVHVREDARVGAQCNIGAGVYVGAEVTVGDRCKVQNDALLYEGLTVEDGVFIGPQVCFTNDYWPRAINPDGTLKAAHDWELGKTTVHYGASVGARAVIVTGIHIGAFAMIGAGSVVTRDVPAHALVYGSPAKVGGWVCRCGQRLTQTPGEARGWCAVCASWTDLPDSDGLIERTAPPQAQARARPAPRRDRRRRAVFGSKQRLAAEIETAMRCRSANLPDDRPVRDR